MDGQRLGKARRLVEAGLEPFGPGVRPTANLGDLLAAPDQATHTVVVRIAEVTRTGQKAELTVFDAHTSIQARCEADSLGPSGGVLLDCLDRGDLVALTGRLSLAKGEAVLNVDSLTLITKSMRPLPTPEEWATVDPESRRKHREVDVLVDPSVRARLLARSRATSLVRTYLEQKGFLEIETPLLEPLPEIFPLRPFAVEEAEWCPRMELSMNNGNYLRRLMVAGFERVYEFARCFRDEKRTFKNDVEFTQLTFAIAHRDYRASLELIEDLTHELAVALVGSPVISFRGQRIDLTPPWHRLTIHDAILQYTGLDIDELADSDALHARMVQGGLGAPDGFELGGFLRHAGLLDYLLERYVQANLVEPTFLCEFPNVLNIVGKEIAGRPGYKQVSELFIAGIELGALSTAQNDPVKVRDWNNETLRLKVESGWQHQALNEPYLGALEFGIPISTSGGLGFDRLLMLLLGAEDIGEVRLFPWKEYRMMSDDAK